MDSILCGLHAEQFGCGPHLVMLHGWGQSTEQLRPLAELLKHHATVHLIDLPGFGKSKAPDAVWSSFDYAEAIIGYLDQHKIASANFLGHSFGGKVSLSIAIQYPERVQQLILAASSGLKRKRPLKELSRFVAIRWLGKSVKLIDRVLKSEIYKNTFIPKFGSKDYLQAGSMRSILVRSVNEDLHNEIGKIKTPTVILWGEKDGETPVEMAYRLKNLIPQAKLYVLPFKGHQLFEDVGHHLCAFYLTPYLTNKQ